MNDDVRVPELFHYLLDHADEYLEVARTLAERRPSVVRLVGHGSSDAAAAYGIYAFGILPGWTALRDSISLLVYYDSKVELSDSVVIALSQSGMTPDVVEYTRRARERGAITIAITNGHDSELARAAETALPLAAGPERWTAMEGGVPVLIDGQCIGGVGVSGGDWETDLRIAKAAVESIGMDWK